MRDHQGRAATLALAGLGLVLGQAIVRRARAYRLDGRTVLITGGSRGLGLCMAREFARRGARLVLASRDAAELDAARGELEARGAEVFTVPCDVTDPPSVRVLVDAALGAFGAIDVLVNNAGVIDVGPLEAMKLEDFERAMATHFWAPLHTTLAVLPSMRARREGRIVNVASIGGLVAVPHLVPYSASKFALTGLSEGLRAELARDGVRVTTVCPGLMRTGSARHARFRGDHRAEYAWFAVAASLPGVSMSAERAARRIVRACERGEGRVVLSTPAKLVALAHGVAPNLVADAMAAANLALPRAGDADELLLTGRESESAVTRSALTALGRRAAAHNNELGDPR